MCAAEKALRYRAHSEEESKEVKKREALIIKTR